LSDSIPVVLNMSNTSCTVLSCSDTPLAIATSTTGFLTTFVALALAQYAIYNVFLSAPKVFELFLVEQRNFVDQFKHFEDIVQDFEIRVIHTALQLKSRTDFIKQGEPERKHIIDTWKAAEGDIRRAESIKRKMQFIGDGSTTTRVLDIKNRILWWWSYKAEADEIVTRFTSRKTYLSFL